MSLVRAPQPRGDAARARQRGGIDRLHCVLAAQGVAEVVLVEHDGVSISETAQLLTGRPLERRRPDGLEQLERARHDRGALLGRTPHPAPLGTVVSRLEADAQADQFSQREQGAAGIEADAGQDRLPALQAVIDQFLHA